ncbi:MAG: hypothetical protein VBE63_23755 [Lamprobacter sp.]|uniref:hypothetical protein n=1 Tax=Lamprobacter sp. TaxID=3100796 RepID=UPI002B262AE0|nr:hypothetical protein [Lamprobacter sp.]MEA3642932.1 hypothetical protein [Lamprobacter sp.]
MDSHLKALIHQRRRVGLAYRRSQSASDRRRLEDIDQELAHYNIDLPGIQHWVLEQKTRNRHPSHPTSHRPEPPQ